MRRVRKVLLRGCVCCIAAQLPAWAATDAAPKNLILEVWINGVNTNVVTHLIDRRGEWWVSRADLANAGVKLAPTAPADRDLVRLASLDGVSAKIDGADQRLAIEARPDCLAPQTFDLRRPSLRADPSSTTGLIASYQVTGTVGDFGHAAESSGANAALGATLFGPPGTITSTMFAQGGDNSSSQFIRLDTTAESDDPDALRRWTIGDAISGGLSWSRSVRFGGFQVATDFTLRPGLTTLPLPAFFGQTAVPSSVDVYVNSARVFEDNVSPGPFEINDLPVVTGDGQATMVVRNVLGQEVSESFSFYASDALLEKGLSSYDFDAGFLRENYGLESFDYGQPMATGTWRYGLSNWLTLEAHGETATDVQAAGAGGDFTVGPYGEVGADAAFSNSRIGQGALYSASFESQSRPFGIFGSMSATADRYADLASIDGTTPPRSRTQLGADLGFDRGGSLAVSWISDKEDGEPATQLASLSYSLSFNQGWYFGATGMHDCANGSWAAQIILVTLRSANRSE